jgi:hypothetical protein
LGYFVLDDAGNNDTAITVVAEFYDFLPVHRRLRCGPHTLNLIGQTLLWDNNQQTYQQSVQSVCSSWLELNCKKQAEKSEQTD